MTMCKILRFKSASLIGIILASVVLSLSFGNVVTVSSAENIVNGLNSSIINEDTDANSSVGADGEELLSTKRIIAIVWIVISIGVLIWLCWGWYEIKKSRKELTKKLKDIQDEYPGGLAEFDATDSPFEMLMEVWTIYSEMVNDVIDEAEESAEIIRKANRHADFIKFDLHYKTKDDYSIVTGDISLPEMEKGEIISFSAMDGENVLKGDEGRDFWVPCKKFTAGSEEEKNYRMIGEEVMMQGQIYPQDSISRLYDIRSTPSELLKIRCEVDIQHIACEDDDEMIYVPSIPFAFTSIGCRAPTHFKCKFGGEEIKIPIVFDEYVESKDIDEARYNWVQSLPVALVHPKQQATANLIVKLKEHIEEHTSKITYIGPDDGANLFTSLMLINAIKTISHLNIVASDASIGCDSNDIRTTSDWEKILWFLFGEDRVREGPPPKVAGFTHSNPEWWRKGTNKSHLIIDTYTAMFWNDPTNPKASTKEIISTGLENRMAHLTNEGVLILVLPKDVSREPFEGASQDKVEELLRQLKNCLVHETLDNVLGYAISKKDWDAIKSEESKEKPKPKKPDSKKLVEAPKGGSTTIQHIYGDPIHVAARDIVIGGNKKKKPSNPFEKDAAQNRKKPRFTKEN